MNDLTAEELNVTLFALSEMERHQQDVADEVYGTGGFCPDSTLSAQYRERARCARAARAKFAAKVRWAAK